MQGGLPTFLDIGQSFSASAITEDNLLQQLLAKNKTLVGPKPKQLPAALTRSTLVQLQRSGVGGHTA